jgi:hypothetical protein
MDTKVEVPDYVLTAEDRCDACRAQAYVYVVLESGELLFCLHHWNENKGVLEKSATEVVDESAKLLLR